MDRPRRMVGWQGPGLALLAAIAAVAGTLTFCSWGWATARGHSARSALPSLHLSFRRAGRAAGVISDQRYAFITPDSLNQPWLLYDDVLGQQRQVPQIGCGVAGAQIFAGVLGFDCWRSRLTPTIRVYSIAARTWRAIPMNPQLTASCGYNTCESFLSDAGSRWLQFTSSDCPMGEHCSFWKVFQNINTGSVEPDPAVRGGQEVADLSSPRLAHRICAPLKVPEGFNIFGPSPGPGELRFYGRWALASSPGSGGGSQTYLQHCGTRLHQLIESGTAEGPLAASPHAVVWQQSATRLNFLFLPSRRHFVIRLPAASSGVNALALTDERLYTIDADNNLWIANLPAFPP